MIKLPSTQNKLTGSSLLPNDEAEAEDNVEELLSRVSTFSDSSQAKTSREENSRTFLSNHLDSKGENLIVIQNQIACPNENIKKKAI